MTLITTPGASNADSYADLAYALAYHAARGNSAWAASTDDMREPALRRATAWLDASYKGQWQGYRVNARAQALDWPRSGAVDANGYTVDNLTIPAEIITATCEAALRELAAPGRLSPDYVAAEAVKTASAGPVSVTFKDGGGAGSVMPILTVVDGILSNLIGAGSRNTIGLVRA